MSWSAYESPCKIMIKGRFPTFPMEPATIHPSSSIYEEAQCLICNTSSLPTCMVLKWACSTRLADRISWCSTPTSASGSPGSCSRKPLESHAPLQSLPIGTRLLRHVSQAGLQGSTERQGCAIRANHLELAHSGIRDRFCFRIIAFHQEGTVKPVVVVVPRR